MAEKEDKSLIGFDPLAWMNEEPEEGANQVENISESEPALNKDNIKVENDIAAQDSQVDTVEEIDVGGNSSVILSEVLNIQGVCDLYEQFLKLLESKDIIEIDASAVTTIDTSTLQLLIVLKQTANRLGKQVVIDFPSDRFIESAELLGLSEMLGVNQAASGLF